MKILIVGAGFAGAVHARIAAEAGHHVQVIDSAPHIGGCAHDRVENGVRVHTHGPHLFHTSTGRVIDWLSRFTDWTVSPTMPMPPSRAPKGQRVCPFRCARAFRPK
ncbi:MAG: NAD(P)-binding protein [Pseudomonadota bacterium]